MRTYPVIFVAILSLAACGKSDDDASSNSPKKTEKPTAVAKPFTGTLSVEILDSAADIVKPFDNWETGFALLQSKLGKPTTVVGNEYYWAIVDAEKADKCRYMYVTKDNEAEFFKDKKDPQDMIGTVSNPGNGKGKTCRKAMGMKEEDLEDPNAPMPSADGNTTIEVFRDGIAKAKSKWVGQNLTMSGVFLNTSTSSMKGSDVKTVTATVGLTGGKARVSCTLIDGEAAKEIKQGTPVTVSGVATALFGGGLSDCTLKLADGEEPKTDGNEPKADGEEAKTDSPKTGEKDGGPKTK